MAKKESYQVFTNKVDSIKKEILDIRNILNEEYASRNKDTNDNGLLYLKRNKDKVNKVANFLLSLRPIPKKRIVNSKINDTFGKILKEILTNLVNLDSLLETEISITKIEKFRSEDAVFFSNLDNLKFALKCLKTVEIRKDLFEEKRLRKNDE